MWPVLNVVYHNIDAWKWKLLFDMPSCRKVTIIGHCTAVPYKHITRLLNKHWNASNLCTVFSFFFQIILEFPFFGQGTFDFNYNLITLLHAITSQQVEFFGKVKTKNWDLWRVVFYIMTNGKRKKLKITFKKCFIDQMIFLFSFKDLMSLFGMILQVYYY